MPSKLHSFPTAKATFQVPYISIHKKQLQNKANITNPIMAQSVVKAEFGGGGVQNMVGIERRQCRSPQLPHPRKPPRHGLVISLFYFSCSLIKDMLFQSINTTCSFGLQGIQWSCVATPEVELFLILDSVRLGGESQNGKPPAVETPLSPGNLAVASSPGLTPKQGHPFSSFFSTILFDPPSTEICQCVLPVDLANSNLSGSMALIDCSNRVL